MKSENTISNCGSQQKQHLEENLLNVILAKRSLKSVIQDPT